MSSPDDQRTSFIPPNFIEKGKILNGTFDIRNAIEAILFALLIGVPVVHLPLSLTTRIIILCMTALPVAMLSLIGIGGESVTAFLMNALRFVKNRRVVYRLDVMPDPKKKRRKQPGTREPKKEPKEPGRKRKKKALNREIPPEPAVPFAASGEAKGPVPGSSPADPSCVSRKKERRQHPKPKVRERKTYDTSTRRGIRKQAREDIRQLAYEQKCAKKEARRLQKEAREALRQEKRRAAEAARRTAQEEKAARKAASRARKHPEAAEAQPDQKRQSAASGKKKKRRFQSIEDYLPVDKIEHGVIYTTDGRYIKILEVEPINFLLRSSREQLGIIYSFISYLKISPVKLQIKMISKRADINQHLDKARKEMETETDPHCRELQEDYLKFVRNLSSREAVSRRFFLIFEYEPFNINRKVTEREILESLETTAQTAKTFLYQCGNEVTDHENPDEFSTDVLYTLLNRSLCVSHPLPERIAAVLAQHTKEQAGEEEIRINEFLSPESLDFRHSGYVLINGVYHSYLYVPSAGYKSQVVPGWLSLLVNAGEGAGWAR